MARLALLALAVAAVASASFPEEEDVLVLGDDNFDEAIAAHDPLLVEFYAPWCGHCKKLAPEYAKAAGELKKSGVRIAKVDATEAQGLAEKFGVQGFPTLKFFRGGKATEYGGGRDASSIVGWVNKHTGPAASTLADAAAVTAFLAGKEAVIVGFAAPGSAADKAVQKVAAAVDDAEAAVTNDDAARAAQGVAAGAEAIVLVTAFPGEEPETLTYTGALDDAEALEAWVTTYSLPLVTVFSPETAPKIFRGALKTHFLFFEDVTEAPSTERKEFRAAAGANRGKVTFVAVPPSESRVLDYFGITAADFPTAILVTMQDNQPMQKFKWRAGDALTNAEFSRFIADFQAGALKAFRKSEAEPSAEEEATQDVKTIVGTSFERVVLDGSKDVLLEVYAPWCGHCKALAPIYDQLGALVRTSGAAGSLLIAKMDGTGNEVDHPKLNIKGFPTIVFFPADKAGEPVEPFEYQGARDLAGLVAFLNEHASVPVKLVAGEAAGEAEEEGEDHDEF